MINCFVLVAVNRCDREVEGTAFVWNYLVDGKEVEKVRLMNQGRLMTVLGMVKKKRVAAAVSERAVEFVLAAVKSMRVFVVVGMGRL
ncbi:hypothetical protein AXG93_163s1070 [Marchantia polymorpha subsp. ruderalis]|uniref:Uncharacterized protein n=1 Tax=Marchantia polymorpha subsp. ruderalis TaxID=1480154 RepID=A0A176VD25_MARPO|nr:hypothetical protein AXG93_163s1070 [Marchantia polymorpha subsp. ruderalis]